VKALSIFSTASKFSMLPPRTGRKISTSFGSRPSILKASAPTSRTSPVYLCIATADGSSRTTPRSGAKMSVLTVPRSIARSSVKMLLRMFMTFPLPCSLFTGSREKYCRGLRLRIGKSCSTKAPVSFRRNFSGRARARRFVSRRTRGQPRTRRAKGERKSNDGARSMNDELKERCNQFIVPRSYFVARPYVGDDFVEGRGFDARDLLCFGDCEDADCEGALAAADGYFVAFADGT